MVRRLLPGERRVRATLRGHVAPVTVRCRSAYVRGHVAGAGARAPAGSQQQAQAPFRCAVPHTLKSHTRRGVRVEHARRWHVSYEVVLLVH